MASVYGYRCVYDYPIRIDCAFGDQMKFSHFELDEIFDKLSEVGADLLPHQRVSIDCLSINKDADDGEITVDIYYKRTHVVFNAVKDEGDNNDE